MGNHERGNSCFSECETIIKIPKSLLPKDANSKDKVTKSKVTKSNGHSHLAGVERQSHEVERQSHEVEWPQSPCRSLRTKSRSRMITVNLPESKDKVTESKDKVTKSNGHSHLAGVERQSHEVDRRKGKNANQGRALSK